MTDSHEKVESLAEEPRKGLFSRHPRLGILIIGALFILPICAMVVTVAVLILIQIQNAQ